MNLYNETALIVSENPINETINVSFDYNITRIFTINVTGNENYTNYSVNFTVQEGEFPGLTVSYCENMSEILIVANISYFNYTIDTLTQYNISPQNESICGYSYSITPSKTGDINISINNSPGTNYELRYNDVTVNTSNQTLFSNVSTSTTYYVNVSFDYINASTGFNWRSIFSIN